MKSYKRMYRYFQRYGVTKLTETAVKRIISIADTSLRSKAWKDCGCTSCKKLGAHIMLMRGHPRIPYTFFHNTYVQYFRFRKECSNPKARKYIRKYRWDEVFGKRAENIEEMEGK